jgi:hypothetical protein
MLKRLFAASALVLGLGVAGFAQKVEQPLSIGFTVGGATGLGDFGSTKASTDPDKSTGLAQTGFSVDLHGAYYLHKNFAIAARAGYNTFFLSHSALQKDQKDKYNRAGWELSDYTSEGSMYSGINALVGPRGAVQLGGIELYVQPLIGFSTFERSEFKYSTRETKKGAPDFDASSNTINTKVNSGLSYGASLGLRTGLSKKVGFLFDVNYLNLGTRDLDLTGKTTIGSVTTVPGGAQIPTSATFSGTGKGKMAISSLSINFGVSIHF